VTSNATGVTRGTRGGPSMLQDAMKSKLDEIIRTDVAITKTD